MKPEVITTEMDCHKGGIDHRLFALELIGHEAKQNVTVCLACTNCGMLIIHRVNL